MPDDNGGSSEFIPGRIDSFRSQQQYGHGALYLFLGIKKTLHQGGFLVDEGSRQLRCIDAPVAHFHEMDMAVFIG